MSPAGNLSNAGFWCCREADLKGALLGLGETVLQLVTQAVSGHEGATLPQESQDLLKGQISELWKHNNPVRTLIGQLSKRGLIQRLIEAQMGVGDLSFPVFFWI